MTATAPGQRVERLAPRSATELAEMVRAAFHDKTPLRVAAAGTWLHAGAPVEATRLLDVSALTGITEYVPGDLTLTAMAGTSLEEITAATAVHGQWLPLDPFGSPRGTLGATLATASAGPLGGSIGLPRDVTVGVSYVTGNGEIVRGGGRVVKNVAGFDLVRLTIGAWGTLGVITEATVRLRARPEADETVAMALPAERDALSTLLSSLRVAAIEPLAVELLSPVCASRIGLSDAGAILVRLAGNSVSVQHQLGTLARLARCERVSADVWTALRRSDPADAGVIRVSWRASELARLWTSSMNVPGMDAHATLARGIVRMRLTRNDMLPTIEGPHQRVVEVPTQVLPVKLTTRMSDDALSGRLRDAFDHARILNRGILGDEAA
jgi:FAD/FMN-containing dehydrogenase